MSRDYTLTNPALSDGRLIAGIIREQNDASLVLQTANERIIVSHEDIEAIKLSTASTMTEEQLEMLSQQEIRDQQVRAYTIACNNADFISRYPRVGLRSSLPVTAH